MEINSINGQNFGARVSGDLNRIEKSFNISKEDMQQVNDTIQNCFPDDSFDVWCSRPLVLIDQKTGFPEKISSVIVSKKKSIHGTNFRVEKDDANLLMQYIIAIKKLKNQDYSKPTDGINWII